MIEKNLSIEIDADEIDPSISIVVYYFHSLLDNARCC